jgi:death-on-curing protein
MIFLTKAEVLEIHRLSLERFGGSPGLRDEGAFESALVAVENRVAYDDADVLACAATYAYHLTMAHAFVDGNKRVGAAAMRVFLRVNDVWIWAQEDDLYELFMAIAAGELRRDAVEAWLRARQKSTPE